MPSSTNRQKQLIANLAQNSVPGAWSSGLCDCSTHCTTCIIATFLPCVQFGQNYSLMRKLNINTLMDTINPVNKNTNKAMVNPKMCGCLVYGTGTLVTVAGASGLNALLGWYSVVSSLCCCISLCLHANLRTELRQNESIQGNWLKDCCTAYWCYPCAMTQEYKELKVARFRDQSLTTNTTITSTNSMYSF